MKIGEKHEHDNDVDSRVAKTRPTPRRTAEKDFGDEKLYYQLKQLSQQPDDEGR